MEKLGKFCINAISIIFIAIVSFLTINSIFSSCYIDKLEVTAFNSDIGIFNIVAIIGVLAIGVICQKYKIGEYINNRIKSEYIFYAFLGIIGVVLTFLVIKWNIPPKSDQENIMIAATGISKNDFSLFRGYIYQYPHQAGMVLYTYLLQFIIGCNNYIGLQIMNIVILLIGYFFMYKTVREIFSEKKNKILPILVSLLFIPLWFYVFFVYGNIFGLTLSMISIYFLIKYLKNRKIKYGVVSAIFAGLAVIIKSNFLINFVAELIILIVSTFFSKNKRNIAIFLIFVIMYVVLNKMLVFTMKQLVKVELNDGVPKIIWSVMGLQESPSGYGWYNGYVRDVFSESGYSNEKTAELAKEDLKERLEYMASNPKYSINFFYKKLSSEWNEPTFQSTWILYRDGVTGFFEGKGTVYDIYYSVLNIYITIIYFGSLCYFILDFKEMDAKKIIFALCFMGGFLFHTIWEAKSQYTITYFVLLIPYATYGIISLSNEILKIISKKEKVKMIEA